MPLIGAGWLDLVGDSRLAGATLAVSAVLAAAGLMGLARLLRTERRMRHEIRGTVEALEDLRSGGKTEESGIDPHSPLAMVHDAMGRLGHDLASRTHAAEQVVEQYRALAEAVHDSAVITTDADGDIRSFSDGAASLLGWKTNEVQGKPASMLFEEDSFREFLPKLARRSLREEGIRTRARMQRSDGTSFPGTLAVSLLRGGDGEASGFLLVVRDASEQTASEDRLRESEQRYRSLVEGLHDGVVIVREGMIVYANPAFAAMFDLSAKQLEGRPLRDRVATRDLLCVEDGLRRIEAGQAKAEEWRCDFVGPRGSGRLATVVQAGPVDQAGTGAALLLVRDESTERRIQDELRRNESQLDAVLESTSDGILVLARAGAGEVVQITNAAFLRRFGLTATPPLGASREQLLGLLRESGEMSRDLSRLVAAPSPREVRRRVEVCGTHLELRQAPLRGRGGELFGRIVVCRDLTAQRRTERKLQDHAEKLQLSKVMLEQAYHRMEQLNSDLTARTEELRTLNEELQTLDEMKSNLLGNVSHELQTPLVAIRGYTEMILKRRLGPVTDEQRKGLELSLTNIDRLISMIDNLLVFSRSDGPQPRLIEFPLRPLIDECVVLLEEKRRAKRVRVDVAVQGGDVRVRGDRDKIQQVFINLLSNAIKFNHEGGVVRISVRGDESTHAEIIIEDTGPGIAADELERVFERHYRARGSAAGPEGSGIGLSIVRDILRLHGCTIRAESEPGQGARFRFGLRLADAPETSAASSPDPAPPRPVAPPAESRQPVEPTEPEGVEGPEPPREPRAESAQRPRFRIIRPLE